VLWILPLALALAGLATLAFLVRAVRRELEPTVVAVDRFGREHRMALGEARNRLRSETEAARRRLSLD
jgi:type IV secretory pathway TrbF-like protein